MPKLPKWIGDLVETTFTNIFQAVSVTAVNYISPHLKRIRVNGHFNSVKFETGQAILIRVSDTEYRNYTPVFFNSESGECELLFHLHDRGPGSKFISSLKVADSFHMVLPRGFNIYKKADYHFFFGDESAIGVFESLKEIINKNGQNYIGVLELDKDCLDVTDKLNLVVDAVEKSPDAGSAAIRYLTTLSAAVWDLWKTGQFYLIGNARSIQIFRKALKEKGIASSQIRTQPYWAEGKVGL